MALELEPLISISELKTNIIEEHMNSKKFPSVSYDNVLDALILLFVQDTEMAVHYINDDYVALLYDPESLEIIGLQIENFEYSFLPDHDEVERVWRLSDVDKKFENFGDLMIEVKRKEVDLTRQLLRVTRNPLDRERFGLGHKLEHLVDV
jgi:hypothetical protein